MINDPLQHDPASRFDGRVLFGENNRLRPRIREGLCYHEKKNKTLTCHGRLLGGVHGRAAHRHPPGGCAIRDSRGWIASIDRSWMLLVLLKMFGLLQGLHPKRARFEGRRRRRQGVV